MAYLGLVPSEHSSGGKRCQGGITKAGNGAGPSHARSRLHGAIASPARISREQLLRQEALPKTIRDIAWKAQERLCRRYRALARAGKVADGDHRLRSRVSCRGFVWAIATQVQAAI